MRFLGNVSLLLTLLALGSAGCWTRSVFETGAVLAPDVLSRSVPESDQTQLSVEPSLILPASESMAPMPARTVVSPEDPARPITLVECLALALENGRVGDFFDAAGSDRRSSVTGSGRVAAPTDASDSIRVFAYDPAMLATEIEQSLSRFDTVWDTGLSWIRTNQLSGILDATPADDYLLKNQFDALSFHNNLLKPLPTGGLAGIIFGTEYVNQAGLPSAQFVNPGFRPLVGVVFEQPLLRGAGVPINEILDSHPGGYRNPITMSNRVPGILLTRIGHAKSQLEFERRVQDLVFKVEECYWNLYSAYWELYSRENGLKQAHRAWLIAKNKQAGGGLGDADLALIEEQYHSFRTQRLEALGRGSGGRAGVLEAERHLRYVIGLPAEDGTRLLPKDEPLFVASSDDWSAAWHDAMRHRPELKQIREDIKAAELSLTKANELLKPDLRVYSKFDVNGLGTTLGGGFNDLGLNGRPEWEVGVHMQVPIGFREGHAETARARLAIAQQMAQFRDQEAKLIFSLQRSYRDVVQFREETQTRRSHQEAALKQLKARLQKWNAGGIESIDLILRAQRNWVDAVRDEQAAVCNYRVALADLERQKGTILSSRHVLVADDRLPACASSGKLTNPLLVGVAPRIGSGNVAGADGFQGAGASRRTGALCARSLRPDAVAGPRACFGSEILIIVGGVGGDYR